MSQREGDGTLLAVPIVVLAAVGGVLYGAGRLAASLAGTRRVHGHELAGFAALSHLRDPSLAWHANVGPPIVYWLLQAVGVVLLIAAGCGIWWLVRDRSHIDRSRRSDAFEDVEGLAGRREIRKIAASKALQRQGTTLRPSLHKPAPGQLGLRLGIARGIECWASVEDSVMVLGPPRTGKGLRLVIPWILDFPGAVITTATRPDNLSVTLDARDSDGRPVGVFDPQGLSPGVPSALRWSPVRGCESPQVAMIRALALTSGGEQGVNEAAFWRQQTQTAVRCLLHAAAVGDRPPASLFEWSLSATRAREAVALLANSDRATPHWDRALEAILTADQRQRDGVWAMVGNTFSSLADPKVLAAVSPGPGERFDPADFLRRRGTLYLLGTASGASATASLVSALIEDVVESPAGWRRHHQG